ncbi:hypothetical protein HPB48_009642 [Haemaphysalis longicornis]|uniref:Uncharacterized protein n=1 Tax=Haemaphysalis longicornis TaxID=44386 RepID=A0A9J6FFK0_HAELO|nr:hypothetical protein HPB48_009642 [Haemaphysalis longicornis]
MHGQHTDMDQDGEHDSSEGKWNIWTRRRTNWKTDVNRIDRLAEMRPELRALREENAQLGSEIAERKRSKEPALEDSVALPPLPALIEATNAQNAARRELTSQGLALVAWYNRRQLDPSTLPAAPPPPWERTTQYSRRTHRCSMEILQRHRTWMARQGSR